MTNSSKGRRCNLLLLVTCYWSSAVCYQPHQWNLPKPKKISETTSRRQWILSIPIAAAIATSSFLTIESASAAATPSLQDDPRVSLHEAQDTLATLLENWERATVDCTYADVPRELLEQKNKELLLEKAATNALFDKSVSVISCKTSNRVVRDYLGATGKGPLVGIDKKIRQSLDWMDDPDQLDDYLNGTSRRNNQPEPTPTNRVSINARSITNGNSDL